MQKQSALDKLARSIHEMHVLAKEAGHPLISPQYLSHDEKEKIEHKYTFLYHKEIPKEIRREIEKTVEDYSISGEHYHFMKDFGMNVYIDPHALEVFKRHPWISHITETTLAHTTTYSQPSPPWHVDTLNSLTLDDLYDFDACGEDVTAYVIDSGVLRTHDDFLDISGTSKVQTHWCYSTLSQPDTDCYGHGTHVAGLIGGVVHGVAKCVTVKPLKVFDCSGNGLSSYVVAALQEIKSTHNIANKGVVNLSLKTAFDTVINNLIDELVNDYRLVVVVSAGNDQVSAGNISPASAPKAITVGNVNQNGYVSIASNFGSAIDFFTFGHSVQSTYHTSASATKGLTGTSQASAIASGLACLFMETHALEDNVGDVVKTRFTNQATTVAGSHNTAYDVSVALTPPGTTDKMAVLSSSWYDIIGTPNYINTVFKTFSDLEFPTGGDSFYLPPDSSSGFYVDVTNGYFTMTIEPDVNEDLDLYLLKWDNGQWTTVAFNYDANPGDPTTVTTSITGSGDYIWRIEKYCPSGCSTVKVSGQTRFPGLQDYSSNDWIYVT